MVSRDDSITGIWPYFKKKKWGFTYITMPPMTPFLGPVLFPVKDNTKLTKTLERKKEILEELESQLPPGFLFKCYVDPDIAYLLPLAQRAYDLTMRYTYRLNLNNPLSSLWSELDQKQRNRLKRAQKLYDLIEGDDFGLLYDLNDLSFKRQNLQCPYSKEVLKQLGKEVLARSSGKLFFAIDKDKEVQGGIFLINNNRMTHCIVTGRKPGAKGVIALLVWHAVSQYKAKELEIFDFEGSMIPPVETFFRSFGAYPTPYVYLKKARSKLAHLMLLSFNKW